MVSLSHYSLGALGTASTSMMMHAHPHGRRRGLDMSLARSPDASGTRADVLNERCVFAFCGADLTLEATRAVHHSVHGHGHGGVGMLRALCRNMV